MKRAHLSRVEPAGETDMLLGPSVARAIAGKEDQMRVLVVHASQLPDGDWRDWAAIERWGEQIARDLARLAV